MAFRERFVKRQFDYCIYCKCIEDNSVYWCNISPLRLHWFGWLTMHAKLDKSIRYGAKHNDGFRKFRRTWFTNFELPLPLLLLTRTPHFSHRGMLFHEWKGHRYAVITISDNPRCGVQRYRREHANGSHWKRQIMVSLRTVPKHTTCCSDSDRRLWVLCLMWF